MHPMPSFTRTLTIAHLNTTGTDRQIAIRTTAEQTVLRLRFSQCSLIAVSLSLIVVSHVWRNVDRKGSVLGEAVAEASGHSGRDSHQAVLLMHAETLGGERDAAHRRLHLVINVPCLTSTVSRNSW